MSTIDYGQVVDEAKKACTSPAILSEVTPITGTWTVNDLLMLVSGIIVILTMIAAAIPTIRHLQKFTRPNEQRHIVRILFTPLIFGICNFFAIWFYDAAYYIIPIAELYEVIALIGLFLLFVAYVIPTPNHPSAVDAFFTNLERKRSIGKKMRTLHYDGSLRWFYANWFLAFQPLPLRIVVTLIIYISHATGCPLDTTPTAAKVLKPCMMVMWIIAIFRIYGRLRADLRPHNAFWKFFIFKLIVMIQVIQEPIFTNLLDGGNMTPTEHVSHRDLDIGIPAFSVCVEMCIISILLIFTFGTKDYIHQKEEGTHSERLTMGAAILDMLDIWDVLGAYGTVGRKLSVLFTRRSNRNGGLGHAVQAETGRSSWTEESSLVMRPENSLALAKLPSR